MTATTTQPLPKIFTFEEYLEYEGEGDTVYELYQGQLIPMPQPTAVHTKICQFLLYQLQQYLVQRNLPLIVVSTIGVRITENTSRIPDIMVCSETLWQQICERGGAGVFAQEETPNLVIEVTSQNWRNDYILKKAEYAFREIPEYWIIDPNKRKIWLCSNPNDEEGYQYQEFLPGQILTSVQFNDLQMPVDLILEPPVVEKLIRQKQESRHQLEQELTIAQERAEMERQRAERLAQRLRELNIDPDQL